MRQLLHFPRGNALHKGFLYYLYEHCFAAAAAPAVSALTFLCAQLLIHLGLHEVCTQPFQHTQHRIRLRYTLQQQFCQICGILFVSH